MPATAARLTGPTSTYAIVNRADGMYWLARVKVVYSVGMPNRPLADVRDADDDGAAIVELELGPEPRVLGLENPRRR